MDNWLVWLASQKTGPDPVRPALRSQCCMLEFFSWASSAEDKDDREGREKRGRFWLGEANAMKFLDWYLKVGVVSAMVGASMELFMIHTGFCKSLSLSLSHYLKPLISQFICLWFLLIMLHYWKVLLA